MIELKLRGRSGVPNRFFNPSLSYLPIEPPSIVFQENPFPWQGPFFQSGKEMGWFARGYPATALNNVKSRQNGHSCVIPRVDGSIYLLD
jgi:hypothetical protein